MGCNFSKTCPPQEFVGAWRGVQDGGVIVGLIIHKQGTYEYAREGPNQHLRARGPINRLTPQLVLESSPYPCACCTYHFQLDPPQLQQPAEDGATPREASLAAGEGVNPAGVNPAGVNPAAAGAGTWVMVVDSLPMIRLDGCHSLEQLLAANAASA